MSKAYEMIAESLNEIIQDLEETGGKNLKRETLFVKESKLDKVPVTKIYKNNSEQILNYEEVVGRM